MTAAILAVIVILLTSSALLTGPSLDDYWTVYLSQPGRGFTWLVNEGWRQDIRPPFFDAWATLLSMAGFRSIPLARLVSNFPALILLLYAARRFTIRLPDQRAYYGIFLLLMLSAPATIEAFGIYRGDFWQLSAFAVQIMLTRHIMFVQQDYRHRTDGMLLVLATLATLAAIMLDYGGALFGGILAMATVLAAVARGLRRWARSLGLSLAIAVAAAIYMISWQAQAWTEVFDLYQNWIEMGATSAGMIVAILIFGTLLHNPVAVGGAYIGRENWDRNDTAFALLIGAALVASLVAIMQVDMQRRLITASNTVDLAVLITALMATAGVKIVDRPPWPTAIAGVALLSSIIALASINLGGGWQAGAKRISRMVHACPTSQVYAASGWRLDEGTNSRTAAREEPIFALGYRRLGEAHDFKATLVSPGKPVTARLGACPVLIWIEQVPDHHHPKPAKIIKAIGLKGLDAARLSLDRTESGLIIRAER